MEERLGMFREMKNDSFAQCFGSGSGSVWIRIIWSDPDPDPYQETIDMDPGSVKN